MKALTLWLAAFLYLSALGVPATAQQEQVCMPDKTFGQVG